MQFKELSFIFAGLLAFGLFSCSSERDLFPQEDTKSEGASMSIFLGLDSRSPFPGENFEEGVGYENYIDIDNDNYRIYFFNSENNTFIDLFQTIIHPSVSSDNLVVDGGVIFNGRLFPEIGTEFKIVVLANWPTYPEVLDSDGSIASDVFTLVKGKTTIADLTTHVGSQFEALSTPTDGGQWLGKSRLMPFYGVRSFNLVQTHRSSLDENEKVRSGATIDLKNYPIPLIRAMAKVEVEFDNPYASFDAVEMSRINSKGFSAPFRVSDDWSFDSSDYYSSTLGWQGNYARGVHLVNDDNDVAVTSLGFTKVSDRIINNDGSVTLEKWVAYIPEYRNIGVQHPASIRVKLSPSWSGDFDNSSSDDSKLWREFFFTSNGEAGNALDIERNNIYRFKIGVDGAVVDIQPFSEQKVTFQFGLLRDDRGDLMVLPVPVYDENGNPVLDENGNQKTAYPSYFLNFLADDNPNHKIPEEVDINGNVLEGSQVRLEDGDYYAIVVGENEDMSNAVIWVKDPNGCHVLSNYASKGDTECSARLVQSFFGNNQSEIFHKDIFGFHRIHHFDNHNSIVIHPTESNMLFRVIENFGSQDQILHYYEVESWDENSRTGWIINKDTEGNEVGFQEITSEGLLGRVIGLDVE